MPKFNLDEDKSLFEPIEIVIDGNNFTISKITNKMFKQVGESDELAEQFSILTGAEVSVVEELNLLKVAKAIQFVVKHITAPFIEETRGLAKRKKKKKAKNK